MTRVCSGRASVAAAAAHSQFLVPIPTHRTRPFASTDHDSEGCPCTFSAVLLDELPHAHRTLERFQMGSVVPGCIHYRLAREPLQKLVSLQSLQTNGVRNRESFLTLSAQRGLDALHFLLRLSPGREILAPTLSSHTIINHERTSGT